MWRLIAFPFLVILTVSRWSIYQPRWYRADGCDNYQADFFLIIISPDIIRLIILIIISPDNIGLMVVIIIRLIFFIYYQPWYYQADNFLDSYQPLYYQAEPLDPAPVFELSWFLRVNSYSLPTGWLNSVCILSDIAYWGNKGNFKILLSLLRREPSLSLFFLHQKQVCVLFEFFSGGYTCWYADIFDVPDKILENQWKASKLNICAACCCCHCHLKMCANILPWFWFLLYAKY